MKLIRILILVVSVAVSGTAANAHRNLDLIYFDGHIHTTHSDGSGSIADVKYAAMERGLNAVIITNHTKQIVDMEEWQDIVSTCEALSERNFLMIPSFEVTGSEGLFCRDHILAWGVGNPFVGDPAEAMAPEEVWESPPNPFGTGPMYPDVIRQWTDWIHENDGIAVHAHTTGTTQLDYNVDYIELINLSHTKDVARFAQMAGFGADEAWDLGVLFNSFSVVGGKYLQMPVDMPNPYDPGATIELPLQQALFMGTSMIGDLGENSGGAQWLGTPNNPDLLAMGAIPAAPLNSWDDLLMAYINDRIDHPIFGVANSDAHNTANIVMGSDQYDDSDVGEAKNGVYLRKLNQGQLFRAIRKGNLFATTGPSLYFDVNGRIMGETVRILTHRDKTVRLNLSACSESASAVLVSVMIIKNGHPIYVANPFETDPATASSYELKLEDVVSENSYYRVEAVSMEADGKPRFAYSNPVFVKKKIGKNR